MVKVDRLPSGNYRARVHLGNGKYKPFTGKDKKDVQLRAAQYEAECKIEQSLPEAKMTLGETIGRYIEQKTNVLSPSTIRGYRAVQKNALPKLMQTQLCDINTVMLQKAINAFASDYSPKYTRNVYGLISATLSTFLPDLRLNITLPQKQKNEVEIPTEEEVYTIFEHVKDTEMEIPVILGACCGMRRSEIIGLKWEDVNFAFGTISINEAIVMDEHGNAVSKGTKSVAGTRIIRMYPFVRDALQRAKNDNKYVVSLTANQISSRFATILKRCGVRHYKFHALRHYLVSVMLSLNIPKSYIADYVGHETEHMIDAVYGHIMARKKTNVEDILEDYFTKSVTKSVTVL